MPSIKNLEMAAAISAYNNISIRKSFFSTKVFYIPTQSPVKAVVQEYSLLEGKRLLQLLDMPIEQMITYIKQNGKPVSTKIGPYRLEVCLSKDCQFCALQLFQFGDFKNNSLFEPRFYEGQDAETIAHHLL